MFNESIDGAKVPLLDQASGLLVQYESMRLIAYCPA